MFGKSRHTVARYRAAQGGLRPHKPRGAAGNTALLFYGMTPFPSVFLGRDGPLARPFPGVAAAVGEALLGGTSRRQAVQRGQEGHHLAVGRDGDAKEVARTRAREIWSGLWKTSEA